MIESVLEVCNVLLIFVCVYVLMFSVGAVCVFVQRASPWRVGQQAGLFPKAAGVAMFACRSSHPRPAGLRVCTPGAALHRASGTAHHAVTKKIIS